MRINQELYKELDPYAKNIVQKSRNDSRIKGRYENSSAGEFSDRIDFSDKGKLLTEAYREASAAPEIRQEKVDRLKALVASGEYKINSRDIADKLIREEAAVFSGNS